MNGLHRTLIAVLALALNVTLFAPGRAEAGVTVEDLELVSKARVGRAIELSYRLTINNVGTTLNGVNVYVSCDAAGTTMLDDVVAFGDIAENAATTSVDTFSIRLDRRVANVPSCLSYVIGFDTIVKLSGTATDMPLANATIIGTIVTPESGRPIIDSGRPIIDTVVVTADADGNYEMELQAVTEDDFITLEAQGVGDQEGAVLTSTVGSVGALQEAGESGSIIVGSGAFGALNITHITTAQDELVRRLNGGVAPESDAELAALQSQVDGAELLVLATVIKTIVDNPSIPLPPGFDSTLELIQDEAAAEQAAEDLAGTPEFQEALVMTADALGLGYEVGEVIGTLYAVIPPELALGGSAAYIFDFDANGGGNVTFWAGSTSMTWLINADGDIEVSPAAPFLLFESFPNLPECANNPSGQCRTLTFLEGIRIVRLANGIETDQVFVLQTTRTTYPDDPLPDEVNEGLPDPASVFLTFGEDGIIPIDPADIAGSKIAAYYYHRDNESVGLNDPMFGADFLTFNGDGTGDTQRRGFTFDWSIDAAGAVVVDFSNGDSNRYLLYDDSDIAQAIVVGSLASGESFTAAREVVDFDGIVFTDANVANRRYRGVFSIVDDVGFLFDFVFLPDGTGCRLQVQPLTWETTPDNLMDSFLFGDSSSTVARQRRAWEVIRVEPGILGDRYWVIEMLDANNFAEDPNYDYADPATTPGRINTYEFIEDLTGQFDPCGQGGSNTLTTVDPFFSDNGGVGNMFDVTTVDGAVEVTGFDLNVDFSVGESFEFAVYTVPDTFLDGITSGIAGCTVICVDVGAWTQVAAGEGTSSGRDQPSRVDVDPIVLEDGTTTGFWITLIRDGTVTSELRYFTGSGFVDNDDIRIDVGAGVTAPDPTTGLESVFEDRVWNGTIYYNTR